MSETHGEYKVIAPLVYRGHPYGSVFTARLDRNAERRAVTRGHITLVRRFTPALQPGSYRLPTGWLDGQHPDNPREG